MNPYSPSTYIPAGLLAIALAGCAVGPDYHRPTAATQTGYKEAAGWKRATPGDAVDRGAWWEMLRDPLLNDLENQAVSANQSLRQAAANYEQARLLVRADQSGLFPTISATGSAERAKGTLRSSSSSSTSSTASSGSATSSTARTSNSFSAGLGASWEPDFWGRVRRQTEADMANAEASAADLANARLAVQSALAQAYVQLRVADERIRLRETAVQAYTRTLSIAENKYRVGIVARSDLISAQAQLDAARAQVIDAGIQRAQLEHAIAVLVGKAPAEFSIAALPALQIGVPAMPAELPSELLERRPDIAAAERRVAAANARIGVQVAAYFPTLSLSASAGYQSSEISKLFSAPTLVWSLGANAAETLLDFGRRRAEVASARAAYDASVASYRGTVLSAFQQIEDHLANLRLLEREAEVQDAAVNEAAEAARIALNEYNAGTVDYTTVATAQVSELNIRQTGLSILENRLTASVALVEALGGSLDSPTGPS